jgi:hypothetical protein
MGSIAGPGNEWEAEQPSCRIMPRLTPTKPPGSVEVGDSGDASLPDIIPHRMHVWEMLHHYPGLAEDLVKQILLKDGF